MIDSFYLLPELFSVEEACKTRSIFEGVRKKRKERTEDRVYEGMREEG